MVDRIITLIVVACVVMIAALFLWAAGAHASITGRGCDAPWSPQYCAIYDRVAACTPQASLYCTLMWGNLPDPPPRPNGWGVPHYRGKPWACERRGPGCIAG